MSLQALSYMASRNRRQRRRAFEESAAEAASNFERPTAVLHYIVNTTLISLRKYEVSRYVTLHDTESGHRKPREATRVNLGIFSVDFSDQQISASSRSKPGT